MEIRKKMNKPFPLNETRQNLMRFQSLDGEYEFMIECFGFFDSTQGMVYNLTNMFDYFECRGFHGPLALYQLGFLFNNPYHEFVDWPRHQDILVEWPDGIQRLLLLRGRDVYQVIRECIEFVYETPNSPWMNGILAKAIQDAEQLPIER